MASHQLGEKQNVKPYILVFVALMALTVVTVAISYLELSVVAAVTLALIVASVKGSLVACYFMHLLSEKRLVLITMFFTILGFFAVLLGPILTEINEVTIR